MPKFGRRSLKNLKTIHPHLQRILNEAIKVYDFSVICGKRSKEDQDNAYENGKSKLRYPKSFHNREPYSLAVDCCPYPIDWDNIERFHFMAGVFFTVAGQMGLTIQWGGNWRNFRDYPHFQIKL